MVEDALEETSSKEPVSESYLCIRFSRNETFWPASWHPHHRIQIGVLSTFNLVRGFVIEFVVD